MKNSKRKRGRPPVAPEARRTKNFTFRSREELRDKLGAAAAATGRSISEEIEYRLDRSFLDEKSMIEALELYYGRELAGILQVLGEAMKHSGEAAAFVATYKFRSRNWTANAYAFAQASKAAAQVLDRMKPAGDPTPPVHPEFPTGAVGSAGANTILDEAATGKSLGSDSEEQDRARRLRRAIGDELAQRINQRRGKP